MSAAEILAQPLCALAFCWRLERRDGVTIGLTSHDRDLMIDGVPYVAAPGMTPSAIRADAGLDAASMDVAGMLSAAAIDAIDLEAGRWDAAGVALYLTEWTAPGELWIELARGTLGAVERRGGAFTAELQGPATRLDLPAVPATSPDCRAALGDARCRVDMAERVRIVRAAAVEGAVVTVADGGLEPGALLFGELRWLRGANTGLRQSVIANDADTLTLADPPHFAVAAGTLCEIVEGCDKRLATCAGRFDNAVNFRGEAFLPGNDLLTRYPGA